MKNRQLMRLNKVMHKGQVKTVDCISPGHVSFIEDRKGDDVFGDLVDLDEVEFIELNHDIFLKCGFVKTEPWNYQISIPADDDHRDWTGESEQAFVVHGGSHVIMGDYREDTKASLEYLHQLQNIYSLLTGNQLNVEL